jgi:hypothetical protein
MRDRAAEQRERLDGTLAQRPFAGSAPRNRPIVGATWRRRHGLTLAELLVASTVTALVVSALAVFAKAVMDGCDRASELGNSTQASRVVAARIARSVAKSSRVLKLPDSLRAKPGMDGVLIIWERDGELGDTAPGQPNFVELVIIAPSKGNQRLLLELHPRVSPTLVAPFDNPDTLYTWIDRFRSGTDVDNPPTVLLDALEGVHFDIDEYSEPEGIGGVVQQNVRVTLSVRQADAPSSVFIASASRRYTTTNP